MVWYGMVNVDLYSAIITKVSNALNTLVSVADSLGGRWGRPPPLLALAIFSASRLLPYKDTLIYVRICILSQSLCLDYKDDKHCVISMHTR